MAKDSGELFFIVFTPFTSFMIQALGDRPGHGCLTPPPGLCSPRSVLMPLSVPSPVVAASIAARPISIIGVGPIAPTCSG
jgi:hypothetical protein